MLLIELFNKTADVKVARALLLKTSTGINEEQNELEKQTSECFNDAFYQINSFKFELENNFAGYKHTNEYKELVLDIQNIESYIVKKQKEHKKEQEKVKILLKNY